MADIFLSYSSKDEKRIMPLVKLFEQQGWSVWWDHKIRVGKEFDKIIEAEIVNSKCLVVLWSYASVQSHWVKSEAEEGRIREILAPALIDNVDIPMGFRRFQTANLSDWKNKAEHPELILLLEGIRGILEQSATSAQEPTSLLKLPINDAPRNLTLTQKASELFKVYPKSAPLIMAVLLILFTVLTIILFKSWFSPGTFTPNENTNTSNLNSSPVVQNTNNTKEDAETPAETVSLSSEYKRAIAIVNIFESGSPEGIDPSSIAIYGNDINYGRLPSSLETGGLYTLIKTYCDSRDAKFKDKFKPFLSRLAEGDLSLASDSEFLQLLKDAGREDPLMVTLQNQIYERRYWQPSLKAAKSIGIKTMLGITVIHDSIVHGNFDNIKDETIEKLQGTPISDVDEHKWIKTYLELRKKWMLNHPNSLMQQTVYRVEELLKLVSQGNWELKAPITIRGFVLTE